MRIAHFRLGALALAAVGLGGCAAYGPMGGVGVSVGYGNGYDPYYDPYYGRYYGSSYGGYYDRYAPYWGWHDGFYYPGSGYYVYDRHRNPYYWSDAQRRYWEWRRRGAPQGSTTINRALQNWADFNNGQQAGATVARPQGAEAGNPVRERRIERRVERRQERRAAIAERQQVRAERQERQELREERQGATREDRREARGRKPVKHD